MSNPERINGGEALIRSLELEGVEVVFGYPGGAILPVYDPIIGSPIRHVLVRHEQGAGHMAEGYAHATGKPGVCMVTSGPAATNIVTPLADAMLDSVPMVCITGQVALSAIGTDAFQECDTTGITRSITKHNFLRHESRGHSADHSGSVPHRHDRAARPGARRRAEEHRRCQQSRRLLRLGVATASSTFPATSRHTTPEAESIADAVELIAAAERPVLYVGGGVLKARGAADSARAGRDYRHPGRHHAHGPRSASPTATSCASACPACTATTPPSRPSSNAIC